MFVMVVWKKPYHLNSYTLLTLATPFQPPDISWCPQAFGLLLSYCGYGMVFTWSPTRLLT